MISSNYTNNASNVGGAQRVSNAPLESPQTSEGGTQKWDLRNYASEAGQDVQNLSNGSESAQEPQVYQLSYSKFAGGKVYELRVNVHSMADQSSIGIEPFAGFSQSRLYAVGFQCDELVKDFPELGGKQFVLDIQQGIDSRMGVQMGADSLIDDAAASKGRLGYEPRTGAKVTQDQDGYHSEVVGGKDGFELPPLRAPKSVLPSGLAQN